MTVDHGALLTDVHTRNSSLFSLASQPSRHSSDIPSRDSRLSSGGLRHRELVTSVSQAEAQPNLSSESIASVSSMLAGNTAASSKPPPLAMGMPRSNWWWPARAASAAGAQGACSSGGGGVDGDKRGTAASCEALLPTSTGSSLAVSGTASSSPLDHQGSKPAAWGWGLFFQTCTAKRDRTEGSSGSVAPDAVLWGPSGNQQQPHAPHALERKRGEEANGEDGGDDGDDEDREERGGEHGVGLIEAEGCGAEVPLMEQHLQEGIAAVVEAMTHSEAEGRGEEDDEDSDDHVRQGGGDGLERMAAAPADSLAPCPEGDARAIRPQMSQGYLPQPHKIQRVGAEATPTELSWPSSPATNPMEAGMGPGLSPSQTSPPHSSPHSVPQAPPGAGQHSPPPPTPIPASSAVAASKRHLYPAGRILHLFPQSALSVGTPVSVAVGTDSPDADAAGADPGLGPSASSAGSFLSEQQLTRFYPVPQGLRPTPTDITSARMTALQVRFPKGKGGREAAGWRQERRERLCVLLYLYLC